MLLAFCSSVLSATGALWRLTVLLGFGVGRGGVLVYLRLVNSTSTPSLVSPFNSTTLLLLPTVTRCFP